MLIKIPILYVTKVLIGLLATLFSNIIYGYNILVLLLLIIILTIWLFHTKYVFIYQLTA